VLEVPGRETGEPRRTPVNLLTLDGTRDLVAPRHTQWVDLEEVVLAYTGQHTEPRLRSLPPRLEAHG
jgi:hypothetical protein